jgi:hypothetical protein
MGAGNQFRMMGGAIILSIATSVFNTYVRPELSARLDPTASESVLVSGTLLDSLPPQVATDVRGVLAEGFNRQMIVLCVCSALQIPASLLMWQKKQLTV